MKAARVLPEGWRWGRLGEVCALNPRRPLLARDDSAPTSFVPMEAVDALSGTVSELRTRPYGEIKRGYTYFENGDVLFAKITPCMQNGKHTVACDLIDGFGFGTTEFHVLRPLEGVSSEYVWYFLRQPQVLNDAAEHFTGAVGQQRLPEDYLANLEIPLPPLAEQQRIAAELREQMEAVARARAAAVAQVAAVKSLPARFLQQAFPMPGQALRSGWKWVRLGQHCRKIGSGITPLGGHLAYVRNGIPLIRSQNVHMNRFSHDGLAFITSQQDEAMSESRVRRGDVLLNITGASIGRVCVVPEELVPANVNQHVSIIRSDGSFDPSFLSYYVSTPDFQRFILDTQAGATRQALTKALIEAFAVPLAPLPEQTEIVKILQQRMTAANEARAAAESQLAAINALPAALLRRAFGGAR